METEDIVEEEFEDASDEADNDYQYFNDPSSTQPSSGPPSTPNSCASSPPINNEDSISPSRNVYSLLNQTGSSPGVSSGKPCAPRRGPGRPRKECLQGIRSFKDGRVLIKKYRGGISKLNSRKKFYGRDDNRIISQNSSSDRNLYLCLTGSPTDSINNSLDFCTTDVNDKNMQQYEDMPYFPEKWSGKLCALCNLSERSQLGQGEMLRLQVNEMEQQFYSGILGDDKDFSLNDANTSSAILPQLSNRRQKGLSKCKNPVNTSEYVDELERIGYVEPIEFTSIQDGNYYYVHRLCATWSFGVLRESSGALDKTASVITQSLRRKCIFCNHYGASVACKMSCSKFFHFPCLPASGGFQIIQNYTSFCKEHLSQVPLICTEDINCRSCMTLGDIGNLLMCSICGDHYHGTCIGLPQIPGVRAGWQCKSCQRCQICRVPDVNEGRALNCEQCHKVYHAHCLRPVMSSIPKYGWKCRRCRVCSDCGSRTPGAGASSRWHAHYTVCDSCYQQRNKGFSCPICHRAYRAAAYREMVKCSQCNKVVHSTCDPEADLTIYHIRKENNPDYDYICPPCKTLIQSGRMPHSLVRRSSHVEEDLANVSNSSETTVEQTDTDLFEKSTDFGLGKGKPYLGAKIGKKIASMPFGQIVRNKGKLGFQRRSRISEYSRKRGTKTKMRGIFGVPGLGLQRPAQDSVNTRNDDEPGMENRLVLCSAKDKFILTQDICVMCGAVGTDQEGCLIACTQCGQCYHPYCVNVKVTKVILKKGWRCLDCTVCEGCGEKNDEARLILCDECDISFHIYCMDPPLEFVPQGNWKCKWCAICHKCGGNSPGKNCTWKNSYSECGPCASQAACSVCVESYTDGELIIQCTNCERWLHGKCDAIKTEEDAEKCDDNGYICISCRPKDVLPPHLIPQKKVPQISYCSNSSTNSILDEHNDISVSQSMEGSHYIDGVYLSEHGLNLIKSLQMEYVRKKRKKITSELVNNKDAGILAAIESVVAGGGNGDQIDDLKIEPMDPKEEAEIYKEGMIWERSDASPPEGFTLGTNEQGVVVLRKKRQRNLQKLGIGGFNVRNRAIKKDWFMKDDGEEQTENIILPPNENEKRKKPLRKRQKNKLTETYPPYLQEAFFGKNLLDTQKSLLESESSDDEAKSSVSEDKIIKLSPEELKILDEMKIEQKVTEIPKVVKEPTYQNLSSDIMGKGTDSSEIIKDIIASELLDGRLGPIIKEEHPLNENSNSLDIVRDVEGIGVKKDVLSDIIPSNFNLASIDINSKDVEDIFQGVLEPETKHTIKKSEPITIRQTVAKNSEHDIRFVAQEAKVVTRFLPLQQDLNGNNEKLMDTSPTLACNINQSFVGLTEKSSANTACFNTNISQNVWPAMSPTSTHSNDAQPNPLEENFPPAAQTQSNCSQKSSERMRRDEDLGEMATISAVLYANTNHPELKIEYPNWTDRCKQIYKRWRALSNEKKAPFLQQARDNRSALRMKKVQQDQEKINTQQKALKEQEQERQWKQLQAMRAKEQQLQQFAVQGSPNMIAEKDITNDNRSSFSPNPVLSQPQFNTPDGQNTFATQVNAYSNPVTNNTNTNIVANTIIMKSQENKQLRDLLQRQECIDGTKCNTNTMNPVMNSVDNWRLNDGNHHSQGNIMNTSTFREPFPVSPLNKNIKSPVNVCNARTLVQVTPKNINSRSTNKTNIELEKKLKKSKDQTSHLCLDDINKTEIRKVISNKLRVKDEMKNVENSDLSDGGVGHDLDKLEQVESVTMSEVEGVSDILGGLGEDDDDELLNSLTAEMGADFNILEYADPELDALTDCNNQNLLDKLDFDDADTDERCKKLPFERYTLTNSHQKGIYRIPSSQNPKNDLNVPIIGNDHCNIMTNTTDQTMKNRKLEEKQRREFSMGSSAGDKPFGQSICSVNRVNTIESVNVVKPGELPKAGNFTRYNIIPQSALCKITRGNLPPPPPPYPGPPPPYPSAKSNRLIQEQPPLLLEDLLEQEKREQKQQMTSLTENKLPNNSYIKNEVLNQGGAVIISSNWRKNPNDVNQTNAPAEFNAKMRKQSITFNTINIQPPPPLPPENILNENDRQIQLNYEQWLNNANVLLNNQLKSFEEEVLKLRKIRKSLNSKQRLLKKAGNELSPQDVMEFTKITAEQGVMQKHLEHLRKQCRQHSLLMQDYKSKHLAKLQMPSNISSPVQAAPVSPMVSPSNSSQSSLLMQTSPSPLGPHILQQTRSPLQSPSPLLSHSPIGVAPSPVNQSNVSPYQNAQSSPRIGTPHSQMDENSFSPSANMSSPSSMSGHHPVASPSPRITSPQQRGNNPQLSARMSSSPSHAFGSISGSQLPKFTNSQSAQDRVRMQMSTMSNQQCLSQNISPMEIQPPLSSPIQINTFGQTADGLHGAVNRGVMHFFQQKHGIQRPNKNRTSSPKANSTPPASPHLQYSLQQQQQQQQQNLNRKMHNEMSTETYSPQHDHQDQYVQHRDNNMMSAAELSPYLRNTPDNNMGSGGGLSNLSSHYLPVSGSSTKYGKFRRIKLGLFGGSPMWGMSNLQNRGNNDPLSKQTENENLNRSSNLDEINANNSNTTSTKSHVHSQGNQSQTSTKSCESNMLKQDLDVNSIVVIDDSPDEKQRIMDYDDYQDKGFVATEVSLNSAAQNVTDSDEMAVIESFATSELADIVSSPLEPEVDEEYVLFSSDVVDYAESDDSMKTTPIPSNHEDIHMKGDNTTTTDNILSSTSCETRVGDQKTDDNLSRTKILDTMHSHSSKFKDRNSSPESKNIATTEDFEAMIDCRPSRKEDEKSHTEELNNITVEISKPLPVVNNNINTNVLTCSRIPLTSVSCGIITGINTQTTTSPAMVVGPKKMVSDVTQATAKVSIGNTTISVPLLKSMTLNSQHLLQGEKQNKLSGNVNLTKQPTILNVRGQKINAGAIVSLSSLQIKPSSNAKIVQATVVNKKLQLPQTTLEGVSNLKHNLIHSFNYPKLSSLTVLQDMSLPNKIFEDESASPENPQEHSDVESTPNDFEDESRSSSNKIESSSSQQRVSITDHSADKKESPHINVDDDKIENKTTTHDHEHKIQSRQLLVLPQLSPLSKPAELTSNMANVSQQLRTIMSSINSSSHIDSKPIDQQSSINTNVNLETVQNEIRKETDSEKVSHVLGGNVISEDGTKISVYLTSAKPSPKKVEISFDLKENLHGEKNHIPVSSSIFTKVVPSTTILTTVASDSDKMQLSTSCDTKKTVSSFSPHLKRSKSTDDGIEREMPAQITGTKRYSLEVISGKIDSGDGNEQQSISKFSILTSKSREQPSMIGKQSISNTQNTKSDEPQNVLLKQLLQIPNSSSNSSNSNTSTTSNTSNVAPQIITGRKVPSLRAPSLGLVSSLEAQLARPVIPPVTNNQSSLMQTNHQMISDTETVNKENTEEFKKTNQIISRETSFVSNPIHKTLQQPMEKLEKTQTVSSVQQDTVETPLQQQEKKLIEEKKHIIEKNRNSSNSTEKPSANIKIVQVEEVKPVIENVCTPSGNNESFEETENVKDEKSRTLDAESSSELKKRRKREYQKNRRQMLNKEVIYSKKRSRKLSKLEEDYDNFIDNLMVQLRQMSSLQVLEPLLSRNYGVCPPYGAGDNSKVSCGKEHSSYSGNLFGSFGKAYSANITDYYNIKPFGSMDSSPEEPSTTIQNGFYDQEFPPIKFENDNENIFKDRDIDTPDSIVTSSSPECVIWDASLSFTGLKLIKEENEEESCFDRMSPIVPVIAPIPIKLKSGMDLSLDKHSTEYNKENNIPGEWKKKHTHQSQAPKDSNVTVTLTLTSSAAEDIMGVLRDLATLLRIPPPTSYQIVERTTTPPSQKLGLYRTKGKDGKEGNPIDIQTILNGTAKFCRHCDVVILNTIIRAKASEFPLLTSSELINNNDDLYFCSKTCYKQFKWRPTNIIEDTVLSSSKTIEMYKNMTSNLSNDIKNEFIENAINKTQNSGVEQNTKSGKNSTKDNGRGNQYPKVEYSDKFIDGNNKNLRYRFFSQNIFNTPTKFKKHSIKEVTEMLFKMNITVTPMSKTPDTRQCIFCGQIGDGVADGPSRLLNFDVDKWIHLNCALWSDGVYETVNGGLMNLENALQASLYQTCVACHHLGATIKCFKNRCSNIYHLTCAIKDQCIFYKNKTTHCQSHALKNEKENELTTLSVQRRVYVERDESRQVAAVMHHSELSNLLRVGSLTFLSVGQLLPHQLQAFHTPNYIYPIGYKIIRFYWSMRRPNKRCRYICSIADIGGRPEFRILVQELSEEDMELRDLSPKAVWQRILEPIAALRKNCDLVQLFPKYITGEDLFGLTEPAVVRILESLPGIETLTDYRFKYGRNPLLELPLAINPSGAARTEPKLKQAIGSWKKPHTQRSGSSNQRLPLTPTISVAGEVACPYSKQFVHSKSSQYKKMKQEWRNNVYLARSKIQGLGLYAARDLEKHTMVIEYIGEVIRTEVSEIREKQYEARNRGIYMFRLDEDRVVDATLSGGLARYINHSCNPNCVTEIVEVDREYRIIIFAKRRINRGEELSYDYKFDIEDDAHKISCMCGAPNCRKWMN